MRFGIIALLTHFLRMQGTPQFGHLRIWELTHLLLRRLSTRQSVPGGFGHQSVSKQRRMSLQSDQAKQARSTHSTCGRARHGWRGAKCRTMHYRKG